MHGFAGVLDNSTLENQLDISLAFKKSFANTDNILNVSTNEGTLLVNTSISTSNDKYIIVYTGELIDTTPLKSTLYRLGYNFTFNSDEELILAAYTQWGKNALKHFNGAFAFAIWEKSSHKLFIARDRSGIKNLFYTKSNDAFIFSSSLNTLLAHPDVTPTIDKTSTNELILLGPGRMPSSAVLSGIKQLEPATYGVFYDKELALHKYWQLEDKEHFHTFDETQKNVQKLVINSITAHLDTKKEIGCFLSGGLDSSIITAIACKKLATNGKKFHTFSVDYKENSVFFKPNQFQPDSDIHYIDAMCNFLGGSIEHHSIFLDAADLASSLYSGVDARALPGMADIDTSLILFCKKTKDYVESSLSGEGADEIFGGYPWFNDPKMRNLDTFPWSQSTQYRTSFLQDHLLLDNDFVDDNYKNAISQTNLIDNQDPLEKRMREITTLTTNFFGQTLIERSNSIASFTGLDIKMPFCDHRIADYVYSIPWALKTHRGHEKGLLRQAFTGLLPENVLWRKKTPYPKTHNPHYFNIVSGMLREIINSDSQLLHIIKKEALEELLISEKISVPWYGQLMTRPQTIAYFIQIDYWLKKYNVKIVQK